MIFGANPLLLKTKKKDPFFANVVSLLHFGGADGATTFTDVKGKTWTRTGNAQIDTAQSKFGGSSGLFDGDGDYISTSDDVDFEFGSGAFTLECFVRFQNYPSNDSGQYQFALISKDIFVPANSRAFTLTVAGTASSIDNLGFTGFSNDATFTSVSEAFSFSLNTWYFITCVRSGNLIYLFVDGTLLNPGGTAFSRTIQNGGAPLFIGAGRYNSTFPYEMNGWIDEVRITKGVARYTSDFTVPTSEFPES